MPLSFELNPFVSSPLQPRARGLLKRHLARHPFRGPRLEDRIDVIPESEWPSFISEENYFVKDDVFKILDQDGVGSCASESWTQSLMIVRAIQGLPPIVFNPWTLYRLVNGGSDSGSTLDDNIEVGSRTGVIPMDLWGREKGWRADPDAAAKAEAKKYRGLEWFEIRSKGEFGTALIKHWPVYYGRAGHAICGVQLLAGGVKYANSWGNWTDCNDPGFGYDPWSAITPAINSYGCFCLRAAVVPQDEFLLALGV